MTIEYFDKIANEFCLNTSIAANGPITFGIAYGFDCLEDARAFAAQYGLELVVCSRSVHREGNFWEVVDKRSNNIARGGLRDTIEDAVGDQGNIYEDLEELEENEVLVRWDGAGTEVVNVMSTEIEFDNVNYIIGVYDPEPIVLEEIEIADIHELCEVVNLAAMSDDYPLAIVNNAIEEFGWEDLQHQDNDICRDEDGNLLTIGEDGKAVVR